METEKTWPCAVGFGRMCDHKECEPKKGTHPQDTQWEKECDQYFTPEVFVTLSQKRKGHEARAEVKSFISNLLASERTRLAMAVEGLMQEWEHPLSPDIERKSAVNDAFKAAADLIRRHSPNK